jgi:hypothetical protein
MREPVDVAHHIPLHTVGDLLEVARAHGERLRESLRYLIGSERRGDGAAAVASASEIVGSEVREDVRGIAPGVLLEQIEDWMGM